MTKRFTKYGRKICDNGEEMTQEEAINKLNEFDVKNNSLNKIISEQGTQIDFLKSENSHMHRLVNENRKLKEKNAKLKKKLYLLPLVEDIDGEYNVNELLNQLNIELISRINDCIEDFKQ